MNDPAYVDKEVRKGDLGRKALAQSGQSRRLRARTDKKRFFLST